MDLINDNLDYSVEPSDETVYNYLFHLFYDQPHIDYPYPLHNMIREYKDGIHRVKGFEGNPITIITRYEDVAAFIRNPHVERPRRLDAVDRVQLYQNNPQELVKQNAMLFISGQDHKRMRGLVSSAFHATVVSSLEERIRQLCDGLISNFKDKEEFDLVEEFCFPLPILVIMNLLGVPEEDVSELRVWSERMVKAFARVPIDEEAEVDVNNAILQCRGYFHELFERRRKYPRDDLISDLVLKPELSDEEIFGTVMITLIAGHETTTNAISTIVLHLLRDEYLYNKLKKNPKLREKAIEEFLRFEPPFAFMTRLVHENFEYKGYNFTKGDELYLHYASANRDPRIFDHPDRIDIDRENSNHFSFGKSTHYCLGAPLARLELRIVLDQLLPILSKFQVISESIKVKRTGEVRGLAKLKFKTV